MITPQITIVYDRHHKANATTKGSIELRLSYNNEYRYMATGIHVLPQAWDSKKCQVKNILEAHSYNTIISDLCARAMQIASEQVMRKSVDLRGIIRKLKGKQIDMTFMEFVELRIEHEKGVKSEATIKNHKVFLRKMKEWGRMVSFSDVNINSITLMNEWLKQRGLQDETIYGYNKHLRTFINDAIMAGYMNSNPYREHQLKIKRGKPATDRFISMEELNKIKTVKLPTDNLRKVRDVFVFQTLTGMAYKDIASFDIRLVKKVKGYTLYSSSRGKTDVPFTVVLLDEALKILQQYGNALPVMSNQQYNMRLKIVAEHAGLTKPLSSHWARHSAAMIWLNAGIPIEIVSRMLGHTSTAMTQRVYASILDTTIINVVTKKLSKKKRKM